MSEKDSHSQSFLPSTDWIAVDLETTGINPWKYEILEIGAVKFNLTTIVDRFQCIIKTNKKHDPKSRAIHKISNDEIEKEGVELSTALTTFLSFIHDDPLVFHNASFDLAFLKIAFDEENLKLPNNFYYDTLYLLRTYKPDLESYSLEYLKNYLEIGGTSHRALADAEVTSYILQWILSDNLSKLNSKKDLKSFLRYNRKILSFEVTLPKNLDNILNYLNKYIKTKSILKICENHLNPIRKENLKSIIPYEVMIFNQKLLLKCSIYPNNYTTLLPLSSIIILDPDKGPITYANM